MLTDAVVKKAGKRDRDYKIADSGGLYLFVSTTGRKTWRVKYRIDGKEKRLVIGAYPDVTLKMARGARDDARKGLGAGRDPQAEKRRERGVARTNRSDTFEKYARMWHAKQCPRWREVHASTC